MTRRVVCFCVRLAGAITFLAGAMAAASAASAATVRTKPEAVLSTSCAGLAGRNIDASRIALPTGSAKIRWAELAAIRKPTGGAAVLYCRAFGSIAPVDPAAYPINFEINLPIQWNGRAVQYGGAGFNGELISGIEPLLDQPADVPSPIARGYMTFGTDSGHQRKDLPEIQAFALNDEALMNFAFGAYKKTHDVAVEIANVFYGSKPLHVYYYGWSEGGREGLTMAQRFPADYDGIVAAVPAINWVGLQSVGVRSALVQQNGGWLSPAKVALLGKAVLQACDALDGLADGIVSNVSVCMKRFDPKELLCADGKDDEECLTRAQVATVEEIHSPYVFDFPLANGVRSYAPWNYGSEDQPGGMTRWVTGTKPAEFPLTEPGQQSRKWLFGNGTVRYFIARDPKFNPLDYSPNLFRERILEISALMDSTDPDLSRFEQGGGKLIIKEHAADFGVSPNAVFAYYDSVVKKIGANTVDGFMRLYVTPGVDHAGAGVSAAGGWEVPRSVDMLGVLDRWVTSGRAPDVLTQVSQTHEAPFPVIASRPLCRYPDYPHYQGGPAKEAKSFVCTKP